MFYRWAQQLYTLALILSYGVFTWLVSGSFIWGGVGIAVAVGGLVFYHLVYMSAELKAGDFLEGEYSCGKSPACYVYYNEELQTHFVIKYFLPFTLLGRLFLHVSRQAGASMTHFESLHGFLFLTNQRLIFRSHFLHSSRGPFSILLPAVSNCYCTSNLGGLVTYLVVETETRSERFCVQSAWKWQSVIAETARELRSNGSASLICDNFLRHHGIGMPLCHEGSLAEYPMAQVAGSKAGGSQEDAELHKNLLDIRSIFEAQNNAEGEGE
jgi:hypothetical protein